MEEEIDDDPVWLWLPEPETKDGVQNAFDSSPSALKRCPSGSASSSPGPPSRPPAPPAPPATCRLRVLILWISRLTLLRWLVRRDDDCDDFTELSPCRSRSRTSFMRPRWRLLLRLSSLLRKLSLEELCSPWSLLQGDVPGELSLEDSKESPLSYFRLSGDVQLTLPRLSSRMLLLLTYEADDLRLGAWLLGFSEFALRKNGSGGSTKDLPALHHSHQAGFHCSSSCCCPCCRSCYHGQRYALRDRTAGSLLDLQG